MTKVIIILVVLYVIMAITVAMMRRRIFINLGYKYPRYILPSIIAGIIWWYYLNTFSAYRKSIILEIVDMTKASMAPTNNIVENNKEEK